MDVFVQVEMLSPSKKRQAALTIPFPPVVRRILKFFHDWDMIPGAAGMAFHRGPDGWLRASHAMEKDNELSTIDHPVYKHEKKIPLRKGEFRSLDIPMRPYAMFWEARNLSKY